MSGGFVFYDGPSELDGQPIVGIMPSPDQARLNSKTQKVLQTYILCRDTAPLEAVKQGIDKSICGDCMHRGTGGDRSCYVQVWSAPTQVWKAYQRGAYTPLPPVWANLVHADLPVRLGTYGDPAAIPVSVWETVLKDRKTIGYTHQWERLRFADLKQWCMASVDSILEHHNAAVRGWRTFRVRLEIEKEHYFSEIPCPASAEGGRKTHCADCLLCGGGTIGKDITIVAHGDKGKVAAFARKVA